MDPKNLFAFSLISKVDFEIGDKVYTSYKTHNDRLIANIDHENITEAECYFCKLHSELKEKKSISFYVFIRSETRL